MGPLQSPGEGLQVLRDLTQIYLRTRAALQTLAQGEERLAEADSRFLAERTLAHVEAMQDGLRLTLRASAAGREELRYVVGKVWFAPADPFDRREGGVARPDLWRIAALQYAATVMGLVPRLPEDLVTYPGPPSYVDIRPPRGPAELKDRLEELERALWDAALGRWWAIADPAGRRRCYAFFEAGAWLGRQQLNRFRA